MTRTGSVAPLLVVVAVVAAVAVADYDADADDRRGARSSWIATTSPQPRNLFVSPQTT